MIYGIKKRVLVAPPKIDKELMKKFNNFVKIWVRKNLSPLAADTDVSVESWLREAPYQEWRKKDLREKAGAMNGWDPEYSKIKSFQKDETYPEYKAPRAINARSDEAKIFFGPIFHEIEKVLFALPYFIKKVPMAERPAYIKSLLVRVGNKYLSTDYTSFESSFVLEVLEACEFELYDYMTSNLPGGKDWMKVVRETLGGTNSCRFKWCDVGVDATRMSGEMCTSLGNGFTNLMLMLFLCSLEGVDMAGVFEGDDGLCSFERPISLAPLTSLGFNVKAIWYDQVSEASFCGMIFDEQDEIIITDPFKVLCNYGWTSGQYAQASKSKKKGLLRAKALSLAYQYPKCPIIQALARYLLRCTAGYDAKVALKGNSMSLYERERMMNVFSYGERRLRENVCGVVPTQTRILFERVYGLSVATQIIVEDYFDGLTELCAVRPPIISMFAKDEWRDYYSRYVRTVSLASPLNKAYC